MRRTDGPTERRTDHPTDRRTVILSAAKDLLGFTAILLFVGCQTTSTRPGFGPLPGSATAEVELFQGRATQILAEALRADSIPVARVVEIDGVIESDWFAVPGYQVVQSRALGPGTVRVRAWVDIGKPGYSVYTIETVYRVYADPSRQERELEQPVAETHPARVKVAKLLERLVERYGEPVVKPDTGAKAPAVDTTFSIDD